jgi:predicted enzyme related to lactoylglutathione lyase
MIIGSHFLLHSKDPEADRAFFRDVLEFPFVDIGHGWMIFGVSPAEAAIHPIDGDISRQYAGDDLLGAVLYLMCDDLEAMMTSLKSKKVSCTDVQKAPWGTLTHISLPSGGKIGMYQATHATALNLARK